MRRILITGMSGTGKSTLVEHLAQRGVRAVDLDGPAWSEYRVVPRQPGEAADREEWVWREEAVRALLDERGDGVLVVSGCASNQGKFYPRFDEIVLLTAPLDVMLDRIGTRTNNAYGKRADERAEIVQNTRTIEPLLRAGATVELNTNAPIEDLVGQLLDLIDGPSQDGQLAP